MREWNGQHTCRIGGKADSGRVKRLQCVAGPDPVIRQRAHQVCNLLDLALGRGAAERRPLAVQIQPEPVIGDQFAQFLDLFMQQFGNVPAARQLVDAFQIGTRPRGRVQLAPLAQRPQMQRQEIAEHLGGHPQGHGQHLGRIVVAGDHAPKLAIDDDRHRHRSRDPHIAQIFAMDRGDAAQMRQAQIEWLARAVQFRNQRNWAEPGIGNDADGVLEIKRARLLGNVAGREILAEETFQLGAPGLAHHLA